MEQNDDRQQDHPSGIPVLGPFEVENVACTLFLAFPVAMNKILILADQFPPRQGGVSIWTEKIAAHLAVSREVIVADLSECSVDALGRKTAYTVEKFPGYAYAGFRETVRSAQRSKKPSRPGGWSNALRLFFLMRPEELARLFFVLKLIHDYRLTRQDWIIAGNPAPMGYYAVFTRFLFAIPFAVICHGGELLYYRSRRIESRKLSAVLRDADVVIANSSFTRGLLRETGCVPAGIRVIHPGVDVRHFRRGPKEMTLIRKLGIENRIVLLTVAHLVEHKGHLAVLAVLSRLNHKYKNLHYLIIGDGPYRGRIEAETSLLGLQHRVTILDRVSYLDLPRYYRICDVHIMLSRRLAQSVEGFGIAFLEAAACGKPSIGAVAGGIGDAIAHERSGFLVRDTADAIARTETLIRDRVLRRRMGEYARRRAESLFTWADSARGIEDAIFIEKDRDT